MAFFGNNAVNYLNLHYGIHSIALSGGGAFFMVYLLNSGVSVPAVFVSLAAILLGRFIVRPVVVGLSARFGLRRMVAAGTLMSAVQYPLLAEVHGVGPALYWLIAGVGTERHRLLADLPCLFRRARRRRAPWPADRRARSDRRRWSAS